MHAVGNLALPRVQALRHRRRSWTALLQQRPSGLGEAGHLTRHYGAGRPARVITFVRAAVTHAAIQLSWPTTRPGRLLDAAATHHGSGRRAQCFSVASTAPAAATSSETVWLRDGDELDSCGCAGPERVHVLAHGHGRSNHDGKQLHARRRA
jgi:hypothetical protein